MEKLQVAVPSGLTERLQHVPSSQDQAVTEALTAYLYGQGLISRKHVREWLGLSWQESEEFLKQYTAPQLTPDDLASEVAGLTDLRNRRVS